MEPNTGKCGKYYASNVALTADEMRVNAAYIYRALTAEGWTAEAVSGLLGNMQYESTINPGRWQGNSTKQTGGYGLAQWTPGKKKIIAWAAENGVDVLMDGQLARLQWEMENPKSGDQYYATAEYPLTSSEFMASTRSPDTLARAFALNYERSAAMLAGGEKAEKVLKARGSAAVKWYAYLQGIETGGNTTVKTNRQYGYWADSGTIDTLPQNRPGVLLFNRDDEDADKMAHVGAYDGSKGTELQMGGHGKIVTLSDGTRKSIACENVFDAKHWTHWAVADVTEDEWAAALAFMRLSIERGDMYLWGAEGGTAEFDGKVYVVYDCSGWIMMAMREAGFDLAHGATSIWNNGFQTAAMPTLRIGAKSDTVKLLQNRLNLYGAEPALLADGRFGPLTKAAVIAFQTERQKKDPAFAVDGVVGPQTWAALLADLGEPETPAEDTRYKWLLTATEAEMAALHDQFPSLTFTKQA